MYDEITNAKFYLFAVPAVIMFGLSKGGLSALGALAIPVLSLVISPVKAAAITLPILIVQDWVGVWSFRREFDRRNLFILIPASLIGVAGAWLLAAHVSESAVRFAVGAISLGFVAFMVIRDRLPDRDPRPATLLPGLFWGAASGFTSFISHAGGPPFLVYVMPQKLHPKVFAGTSVIFFAGVNLLKLPPYLLLSLLTQSISNASIGIYFPKFTGAIFEILSAPLSYVEIVIAYVGAAATKSVAIGLIILATATLFVPVHILHPFWMVSFLLLTSVACSLFGFIIGIWSKNFEQLAIIPALVVTPLTFLGGAFYTIDILPPIWRTVSLFNPVVYLVSGFRWSFYGLGDVSVASSLGFTALFIAVCLLVLWWIFRTGYRLKP